MKMFDIILSSMTMVVLGFMTYFSYMFLRGKIEAAGKKTLSFGDEARYNKMLDEIMFTLNAQLHASNVFLARFHNNGHWNNGYGMKKFTIMLEKPSATSPSIQQEFKDVLCSRYPEAMDFLLFFHTYHQADLSMCKDPNVKRDFLAKYGYSSLYLFLIRQADGDHSAEAFIGVLYNEPRVMSKEHTSLVKSKLFDILGLLNMTEPKILAKK